MYENLNNKLNYKIVVCSQNNEKTVRICLNMN